MSAFAGDPLTRTWVARNLDFTHERPVPQEVVMSHKPYDAIVVGARCAGSPTAMLLARKGHRVLVVDRETFPSDTVSTHLIHPPGVAALRRWGLLDRLVATGAPPIDTYAFDFGPFTLSGAPGSVDEPLAYAPRRTVLDKLLVDAASEAGAEVREGFAVEELLFEDGRVAGIRGRGQSSPSVTAHGRVVIGADGRNSLVSRTVTPEQYNEKAPIEVSYYSYWSGLPMSGRFETYIRPGHGFAAWPTNDGLTLVICGWPIAEFDRVRNDVEGQVMATFDLVPSFAERIRKGKRQERFVGTSVPNFFRKPFGPGWALVGDAGYNKDFITAQGIADAFLDAERCSTALDEALSGDRPFDDAMIDYQSDRDQHAMPMYEMTAQIAMLAPPPPQLAQVLMAARGNREAMDAFARVNAGVTSPSEFFSPENVGRIMAIASASAAP
jgi:2-polyprenyl-6-methoxyphenol hydroxylase-like FAD-dependent oxidoreductase